MRESLRWKETLKGKKTTEVDSEKCCAGKPAKVARFHRRYQGGSLRAESVGRVVGVPGRRSDSV